MNRSEFQLKPLGTNYLHLNISAKDLGFSPSEIWCPMPTSLHRTEPYPVPKTVKIGIRDTQEVGAKFTPSPMAVVVQNDAQKTLVCIGAKPGKHLWSFVDFTAKKSGVRVKIDLEGHTPPAKVANDITAYVLPAKEGEESFALISRGMKALYPSAFRKTAKKIPDWWRRPIYCGWGDQVAISLYNEGMGAESRALAYCIQGLYERWVNRLEQAELPIGTIIIDAGWSMGGVWKPNPIQWPDLKGFIREQHRKGRKVLLWLATWLNEGLPDKWCSFVGNQRLTADPTNSQYRAFVRKSVQHLLSSKNDGLDADGFKIDQLGYTPTEHEPRGGEHFGRSFRIEKKHPKIKISGSAWGCELLYMLQKEIYDAAMSVKPSALISSSTVHPYFHDTYNMNRLHDTGSVDTDVFAAMKARANIARAVLPHHIIDADNWVHTNYKKWLDYTLQSYQIGVPCIFYSERFVRSWRDNEGPNTQTIPMKDLRRIAGVWDRVID